MSTTAKSLEEIDISNKKHLGLVIVGHVDAGKSTTTGHLLFELGGIKKRDMDKLKEEAKNLGKESFSYAFFMDKQKDERERGITISCTTKEFFTPKYHYTIIDAPGHRDFIKNMISGASQADVALLMVPANKGGFETSIQRQNHKENRVQGQTRQHAKLCFLLGIEQIIVGVNKMDTINYSEERYNEIKGEEGKMLKGMGFRIRKIPFIPMSGFNGENLTSTSKNMPWYKGFDVSIKKGVKVQGHTLIDALNNVVQVPKRSTNVPFRMPISQILKITGIGNIVTGRIEQGKVSPGATVRFIPSGAKGKVFTIEMHHRNVAEAGGGDNVGINIKGLDKEKMPKKGDIMVSENDIYETGVPNITTSFQAIVVVQDHPNKLNAATDKTSGFTPSVHIRTAKAPCKLTKIHWKKGRKTGNLKIENPLSIENGDTALVTFTPQKPIYIDTYERCPGLGRIAAMDSNTLVILGKVMDVTYRTD